jgi:SAM-dependent methyltransferase
MGEGAANAETIRELYTPITSTYDEVWAPLLRAFGLRLLDGIDLRDVRRVLDLGCGVGKLLPDLAQRAPGGVVVGSDLVEAMIRTAPARFPRLVMDCTRSAFDDAAFDVIVSTFMLFHVPRPDAALAAARAALQPGGQIAIAVWGTGEDFPAMTAWDGAFDELGVPPDPAAEAPPDGRDLTDSPEKMAGLLEAAGFVQVRSEGAEWNLRWDLHRFLRWRRGMGPSRRRLALLDPDRRDEVFGAAADRIATLDADALVHRDQVVLAWGEAPPGSPPGRRGSVR